MNFYVMKPDGGIRFGTKWAYADQIDPVNFGDYEVCPVCGGPVSMYKWIPPHRIKLSSAKPEKWGDFLWGAGFPLIVSNRLVKIYEAEGLSGIAQIYPPVEVVRAGTRKTGDLPEGLPTYHLIDVPWGGASQDDEKSGLRLKHPEKIKCSYCRVGSSSVRVQERIVIDENSWDGSDIFNPRGAPASLMVSERFKEITDKYQLKNIWLIPAEKYAFDETRTGLHLFGMYVYDVIF